MGSTFVRKWSILAAEIRRKGTLSMGEACMLIGVSPWSIRTQYAPVLCEVSGGDIRFDKHFTYEKTKPALPTKLDRFAAESIIKPIQKAVESRMEQSADCAVTKCQLTDDKV